MVQRSVVLLRSVAVYSLSMAAMAGAARASSFIVIEAPSSTPSIITLGPPVNAADAKAKPPIPTPSIIALGEPAPGIAYEDVAAIPPQRHDPARIPMVIRGGIVGGDSASPSPPAAKDSPRTTAAKGKPPQAPAEPPPAPPTPPPPAMMPQVGNKE